MSQQRLHTAYPRIDAQFPHFAPALGAQPLINQPERSVEQALTDSAPGPASGDIRSDPWPEVAVGVGTAAFSGAITGGIAAGSWPGAGIGAGVNMAAWSAFTLLGSWRNLGSQARTVLASGLVAGIAGVGAGVWLRRRREAT